MLISDIRRANVRAIIAQVGGQAEFGRRIQMSDSQVSQLIGENFTKNIGNMIARRIEDAFNKPAGWLDVDQTRDFATAFETRPVVSYDGNNPDMVEIAKVKLRLSAGVTGFATEVDEKERASALSFRKDWLQKHNLDPERLLVVGVRGDSMEPTMSDGDSALINLADTKPVDNRIFAVNFDGEAVIKRMVKDFNRWFLVSDNPDQKRYHRQECSGATCIIIGRVIVAQRML